MQEVTAVVDQAKLDLEMSDPSDKDNNDDSNNNDLSKRKEETVRTLRQTRKKTEAKPTLEKTLIFDGTFAESPMRTPFGKSNKCQRTPPPLTEQGDTKKKPVKPELKTSSKPGELEAGPAQKPPEVREELKTTVGEDPGEAYS